MKDLIIIGLATCLIFGVMGAIPVFSIVLGTTLAVAVVYYGIKSLPKDTDHD